MHRLEDAPLGLDDASVAVQCLPLYNHAVESLSYTVDLTAIKECQAANHGVEIFRCLNPTGRVYGDSVTQLRWQFRPLEAKEYTVAVPITIADSKLPPQVRISCSSCLLPLYDWNDVMI